MSQPQREKKKNILSLFFPCVISNKKIKNTVQKTIIYLFQLHFFLNTFIQDQTLPAE